MASSLSEADGAEAATSASSVESDVDIEQRRRPISFYVDTVFPIRVGIWDVRYLLAQVEKESLLKSIQDRLPATKEGSNARFDGFRVDAVEAREKDGGAFVKCSYLPLNPTSKSPEVSKEQPPEDDGTAQDIANEVIAAYNAKGERPWYSFRTSQAHLVKGHPWLEDILDRFPSSTLRIEYESGPDLTQEEVYTLFRPYGRIRTLEPQPASNKDVPRFCNVTFVSTRMAAAARNSLYGYKHRGSNGVTALRILYKERTKGGRAFRDWMTSHPRIVIPILAVLAGGLSYAIFDPIRSFFVKSKASSLFSVEKYRIMRWLKRETIGRLGNIDLRLSNLGIGGSRVRVGGESVVGTGIERERMDAAERLRTWLNDMPDTFVTVTGPPGSGKSALVSSVTSSAKNLLVIDCAEIVKAGKGSDGKLVAALASQMGYFPQFQWASSFNNLIDIASVGLIGTKAGFATNLDVQIKQILDVSANALKSLADEAKNSRDLAASEEKSRIEIYAQEPEFVDRVKNGWVHHGRLDCVASTGIIGELGMGCEPDPDDSREEGAEKGVSTTRRGDSGGHTQIYGPASIHKAWQVAYAPSSSSNQSEGGTNEATPATSGKESTADIDQMPIVIIRGFEAKDGGSRDVLWSAMADWAATLVENRIAHCIFVNDSVAVSRSLARALPSKPFNSIVLTDATAENAIQYIQKKLKEYGKDDLAANANSSAIERLGGRLTDLETLIQKMRGGAEIDEAVDDIIARSSTEIVKNCFGDDIEEAKLLPWTREQAWYIVKKLSKEKELSYADLLAGGPFKDQEKALRALEQSEIISILHRDGLAAVVRPGKPSYRAAFQTLAQNAIFAAQNELALNSKATAGASATIKSSQEELVQLSQLFANGRWIFGGTSTIPIEIAARVDECLKKMHKAQDDLVKLGGESKELKERLAKL